MNIRCVSPSNKYETKRNVSPIEQISQKPGYTAAPPDVPQQITSKQVFPIWRPYQSIPPRNVPQPPKKWNFQFSNMNHNVGVHVTPKNHRIISPPAWQQRSSKLRITRRSRRPELHKHASKKLNPLTDPWFPRFYSSATSSNHDADSHRCFFCGEGGHTTSICGHGRPITCHNCDRTGHKACVCPY